MADVIMTPDGRKEVLGGLRDFRELAGSLMGDGAGDWLGEYLRENYLPVQEARRMEDGCAREVGLVEEHYRNILREIAGLSELACSYRNDGVKVGRLAEQIGDLARRNL